MHLFSRIDQPVLASILQKGLDAITPDERSAILRKWFTLSSADKNRVKLTPKERSWIAMHPEIRLGIDIGWPPFEFVEDGQYKGISSSYVKWIAAQLELNMAPATHLTWQEVIKRTKAGELDLLPAVMATPEREEYLNFTKPYIRFPMVIANHMDTSGVWSLNDLAHKRVGVVKDYVTEDILRRNHPEIQLVPSSNLEESLKALEKGLLDAVFGNLGVITYQIEQLQLEKVRIAAATDYDFELAMGVRKDWPELVAILDKTLAFMPDEQHAAIKNSWLAVEVKIGADLITILWWAVPIGLVLTIIISLIAWWNRRLGREIHERQLAQEELARERKLLEAVLESIQQGLVAYDENLRLIVCNSRFQKIRGVPDQFTKPGSNFEEWIRYDVKNDEFGSGDPEEQIVFLLDRARNFRKHKFERVRPDGTVIHVEGGPLPGGGFVSTFADISKRKQAEQKQAELLREINFQKYALDQHAIVSITDAAGNITYVNEHFCEISGYEFDEVIGQNHRILKSEEHPKEFYREMWRTIIKGDTWHGEVKNRKKDGGYYWVAATIVPFLNENGKPFQYISIRTDITERKDAELEMKKLSTAVAESPVSVIITDVNGVIEYVNKEFQQTTGYSAGEVLGRKTNILSSGKTDSGVYDEMWAILLSGLVWNGVLLNRKKNGDLYWKQMSISPIKDDDGQIINFVGVGQDITEQKKLHEERQEALQLIDSSLHYASRIQRSILPPEMEIGEAFKEHFILWEPRDLVGGDMYWHRSWGRGSLILLGDCTGHGVPGAFMTLISNGALDEAYLETPPEDPAALLQRMHQLIQASLGQDLQHDGDGSDDGIEVGACFLDDDGSLIFAGARFELFILDGEEVSVIKGVKAGLGYRDTPKNIQFVNHEIKITADKTFYMTSDGIIDQIGGEKRRSFGKRRFKNLLTSIADAPLSEQKDLIHNALLEYQGNQKRRDDLSIVGFKCHQSDNQRATMEAIVEMEHMAILDFKPIDDDHKRLFAMIGKLNLAIVKNHEKSLIVAVLDELVDYTAWHFRHEERLMQINEYPNYQEHKNTHQSLVEQVMKIQSDIKENDTDVSIDLMVFLLDWLNEHINNVDKKLADFLNGLDHVQTAHQDDDNKEFFILDESLLVGFDAIDDDHKKLVALVNQLHNAVAKGLGKISVMEKLDELVDYTAWHFRHEERLMQTNDYPHLERHQIKHKALIAQVQEIQEQFKADDLNAPGKLNRLIKNWLINHILKVDNKLADFLNG